MDGRGEGGEAACLSIPRTHATHARMHPRTSRLVAEQAGQMTEQAAQAGAALGWGAVAGYLGTARALLYDGASSSSCVLVTLSAPHSPCVCVCALLTD